MLQINVLVPTFPTPIWLIGYLNVLVMIKEKENLLKV